MPNSETTPIHRIAWTLTPAAAETLVARAADLERRAHASAGAEQFEIYRGADDPLRFLLYAQVADAGVAEDVLADGASDVERSSWTLAASYRGIEGTLGPPGAPARHVTSVRFALKAGTLPRMLAASREDIEHSSGIQRFDVSRSTSDPSRFHIFARWVDREAWERHNATPEYAVMAGLLHELHADTPNRTLWSALVPAGVEQRARR